MWYFAQTKLGAVRVDNYKYQFIEQPKGWVGPIDQPLLPKLTNLRHDPFERMNWPAEGFTKGSVAYWDSFKHEMWRFQISAQMIAKYAPSFIEYPPMQAGASFTPEHLKEKIEQAMKAAKGHNE